MPGPLQDSLDFQLSFPAPLIKSPQLPGGLCRCLRNILGCRAAGTVPRGRFLAHAHGWIVPLSHCGGQGLQAFLQATVATRQDELLGKANYPIVENYSIVENKALSSAVSWRRSSGVPISWPSMWFTGARRRMLEISQTASASSRSFGSSGP